MDCFIKARRKCMRLGYKNVASDRRLWMDHKYQLTAYAFFNRRKLSNTSGKGFMNYIPEKWIIQMGITPPMKIRVKRIPDHIKGGQQKEFIGFLRVRKEIPKGGLKA